MKRVPTSTLASFYFEVRKRMSIFAILSLSFLSGSCELKVLYFFTLETEQALLAPIYDIIVQSFFSFFTVISVDKITNGGEGEGGMLVICVNY